mgnify:CR=1 FL=1
MRTKILKAFKEILKKKGYHGTEREINRKKKANEVRKKELNLPEKEFNKLAKDKGTPTEFKKLLLDNYKNNKLQIKIYEEEFKKLKKPKEKNIKFNEIIDKEVLKARAFEKYPDMGKEYQKEINKINNMQKGGAVKKVIEKISSSVIEATKKKLKQLKQERDRIKAEEKEAMDLAEKAEKGDKEAAKKFEKYEDIMYKESLQDITDKENALRARLSRASRKTRAKRKQRTDDKLREYDDLDVFYDRPGYDETVGAYRPKEKLTVDDIRAYEEGDYAEGGIVDQTEKLLQEGGLSEEGGTVDPISGNEVPVGSTQEEVRDDIPAQLSEGEFVFPADVVRFIGLDNLMKLRQEAKAGLAKMDRMGQMGNSEEAVEDDTGEFDTDIDNIIGEIEREAAAPRDTVSKIKEVA